MFICFQINRVLLHAKIEKSIFSMKKNALLFVLLLSCSVGIGQTVNIGDILCTDGSTVSREAFLSSGKTAKGIKRLCVVK